MKLNGGEEEEEEEQRWTDEGRDSSSSAGPRKVSDPPEVGHFTLTTNKTHASSCNPSISAPCCSEQRREHVEMRPPHLSDQASRMEQSHSSASSSSPAVSESPAHANDGLLISVKTF